MPARLIKILVVLLIIFGIFIAVPKSVSSPKLDIVLTPTPSSVPVSTPIPTVTVTAKPIVKSQVTGFFRNGPFGKKISGNAVYVKESRIGAVKPSMTIYSMPIYRINGSVPLIAITNPSGRVENWPIPTTAIPASGEDHHMGVVDSSVGIIYEMWNAKWEGGKISAGGMKSFPISGNGISNPINQRVTAAGFAVSAGMIVQGDSQSGIYHALSMALPSSLIQGNGFVVPAVAGEKNGSGDIPLGALFALPKTLDVNSLKAHPWTKAIVTALRDYGVYVNDRNGGNSYNGLAVGTFRVEPGVIPESLFATIQSETFAIIKTYGIFRVK